VLDADTTTIRLYLHLLGVAVWVGGQIVLAGLVPALRALGSEVLSTAARRFQLIAWPGFLLVMVTGIWNTMEVDLDRHSDEYVGTFGLKMTFVTLSGLFAGAHVLTGRRVRLAVASGDPRRASIARATAGVLGGGGLLFALAAAFCGIQLRAGF
jgi:putative copper export protein